MEIITRNPATNEELARYSELSSANVAERVKRAQEAFLLWRKTPHEHRATRLREAAQQLLKGKEKLARLMAMEMGKPLAQGQSEIEKCAWVCEFYAEQGAASLAVEKVQTEFRSSYVAYQPLGIILAVMPWNFPFWQVFRAAAPALMAGNAMLLKHASNVTGCALAIETLFHDAGFFPGLFATLIVGSNRVEEVIKHPLVRGVTLTGSCAAGRSVAALAGQHLKKSVLELGGSDPYVVLEDADMRQTVESCAASRLINSGQSCIAAKRFIVIESVLKRFEEELVNQFRERVVGDPMDPSVTVGPMARPDLREELHGQVQQSLAQGAQLLLGGELPAGPGAFYPPTILTRVRPGQKAFDEETFGPVAAVVSARDEAEAIALANLSSFGLGAAVFTTDHARGERLARESLEAGCCFINDFVKSDPRLPFGGIKDSGYGRELGVFGIREFVNVKTVCVK